MRKLIVTNIISLDGYYDGPGGNVMVLPMDERFDAYNAERLAAADTLLLGRNSYEMFRGFWPQMADNPEASPTNQEISRLENAIEKVVVSDSLTPDETEPWEDSTRIVRRAAHEQIAELKRGSGREILVFASRTLWNNLLSAGLVDELHLILGVCRSRWGNAGLRSRVAGSAPAARHGDVGGLEQRPPALRHRLAPPSRR